jgi:UDP:flavonoid glycosyltransferase YjiC (YdhE family)
MFTLEELDYLASSREGAVYVGSGLVPDDGEVYTWVDGREPKLFAQMQFRSPAFMPMLKLLMQSNVRAVVVCPDAPEDFPAPPPNSKVKVERKPANLRVMAKHADVVMCQAVTALAGVFLGAGVPVIGVPGNLEQGVAADAIEALGAGLNASKHRDLPQRLVQVAMPGPARAAAKAIGDKYADVKANVAMRKVADLVEDTLRAHGKG